MAVSRSSFSFTASRFVLASGSLKEVAGGYGVTYPTVRLRLDRLIQKIHLSEDTAADPYIALIKRLAVKMCIRDRVWPSLRCSCRCGNSAGSGIRWPGFEMCIRDRFFLV